LTKPLDHTLSRRTPSTGFCDLCTLDPELPERTTARRAELDELEERLAKQLTEIRAERDELAVAERVLERMSEQLADERTSVAPAPGQVGGRTVMLIPHRTSGAEETAPPPDYQRILAAVRQTAGPVMARQVGDALGIDVSVRGKLEPPRGKLVRLVDRGWLRKLPDGRGRGHAASHSPHAGRRPSPSAPHRTAVCAPGHRR
jgi:hypothetical protein